MPSAQEWDYFISYAGPDRETALRLNVCLRELSRKVFVNTEMPPGVAWPPALEQALEQSRTIVFLISKHTKEAPYQQCEMVKAIELARKERHAYRIVPVPIEKGANAFILETLQAMPRHEMEAWKSFAKRLDDSDTRPRFIEPCHGAVLHARLELGDVTDQVIERFLTIEATRFLNIIHGTPAQGGNRYHVEFHEKDCVVLFKAGESPRQLLLQALALGLHLHLAAKALPKPPIVASITHWVAHGERTEVMTGGERSRHFLGRGIDEARQLLSLSNRPHVLISGAAYNLLGRSGASLSVVERGIREYQSKYHGIRGMQLPPVDASFRLDQFIVHDQDKCRHELLNLTASCDDTLVAGDLHDPLHQVGLEFRPTNVALHETPFFEKLIAADSVCILGITHARLHEFLALAIQKRQNERRNCWSKLQIVFPSLELLKHVHDQHNLDDRVKEWNLGRRAIHRFLHRLQHKYPQLNWECREYPHLPPFVGQRFAVGAGPEWIRIASLLPGQDSRESYYVELFSGTRAYGLLNDSFSRILTKSRPMEEWIVYGRMIRAEFALQGLINRRALKQERPGTFPIVLVVLHTKGTSPRVILQRRTETNADDGHDTYSNISGSVTDRDFFKALNIETPEAYLADAYDPPRDTRKESRAGQRPSQSFSEATNLPLDRPVNNTVMGRVWRNAAVRELFEELGMRVDPERLVFQYADSAESVRKRKGDHAFCVFSLAVTAEELGSNLDQNSPSQLAEYSMAELKTRQGQLNNFLRTQFKPVFVPIFRKLKLA